MGDRFDHDSERAELRKLIARYDERAAHYEYEYQINGIPSQERAWMRNQRMADSLRAALNGKDDRDALIDLKLRVCGIETDDAEKCAEQVKRLQKQVQGGDF